MWLSAGGGSCAAPAADSPASPGLSAYDAVRVILPGMLLLAAGLKAHQLATEPVPGRDIFSYRGSLTAQVEFEIFLGV